MFTRGYQCFCILRFPIASTISTVFLEETFSGCPAHGIIVSFASGPTIFQFQITKIFPTPKNRSIPRKNTRFFQETYISLLLIILFTPMVIQLNPAFSMVSINGIPNFSLFSKFPIRPAPPPLLTFAAIEGHAFDRRACRSRTGMCLGGPLVARENTGL